MKKILFVCYGNICRSPMAEFVMKKLAEEYPEYQFEKHKGYGTKLHNELILKYGASDVHRKTFLRKLYAKNGGEQS